MILRIFQSIRRLAKTLPRPMAPWKRNDEQALRSFLRTPTGQLYSANLRNMASLATWQAVHAGTEHELAQRCGYAQGAQAVVAYIDSMATVRDETATDARPEDTLQWMSEQTQTNHARS